MRLGCFARLVMAVWGSVLPQVKSEAQIPVVTGCCATHPRRASPPGLITRRPSPCHTAHTPLNPPRSYRSRTRSLLREWELWRRRKMEHRRQELRGYYLFAFTTLGKVMQRLQGYAAHRVQRRAQEARADLHCVAARGRRTMHAWRAAQRGAGVKAGKLQAASCFGGHWAQRRTWLAWCRAVSRIQECRAGAERKLTALAVATHSARVASALRGWQVSGCLRGAVTRTHKDAQAEGVCAVVGLATVVHQCGPLRAPASKRCTTVSTHQAAPCQAARLLTRR